MVVKQGESDERKRRIAFSQVKSAGPRNATRSTEPADRGCAAKGGHF
jgi:hypothetical protein